MPSGISSLFERSCADCHSERTQWPWYSRVPPASWLIEDDVDEGRRHLNLSRWEEYTGEEQLEKLSDIATVLANDEMPPKLYRWAHPQSKLASPEVERIVQWVRQERRRLKDVSPTASLHNEIFFPPLE